MVLLRSIWSNTLGRNVIIDALAIVLFYILCSIQGPNSIYVLFGTEFQQAVALAITCRNFAKTSMIADKLRLFDYKFRDAVSEWNEFYTYVACLFLENTITLLILPVKGRKAFLLIMAASLICLLVQLLIIFIIETLEKWRS